MEYKIAGMGLDGWVGRVGLRLQEIDHLVIGLELHNSLPPHLWIIARMKDDFDIAPLREKRKMEVVKDVPLHLRCLDDHSIIFCLDPSDLQSLPKTRHGNLEQLDRPLVSILRERCKSGPIWLVVHVEDRKKQELATLLALLPQKIREPLEGISTATVFVHFQRGVTLEGAAHCKDAAAARTLEKWLQTPRKDVPVPKIQVDDTWVSLQLRTDLAGLTEYLSREGRK